MGNVLPSIKKINFEDMQYFIKEHEIIIINTLDISLQIVSDR